MLVKGAPGHYLWTDYVPLSQLNDQMNISAETSIETVALKLGK